MVLSDEADHGLAVLEEDPSDIHLGFGGFFRPATVAVIQTDEGECLAVHDRRERTCAEENAVESGEGEVGYSMFGPSALEILIRDGKRREE